MFGGTGAFGAATNTGFGATAQPASNFKLLEPNTNQSYEVPQAPNDTISMLAWSPAVNHLAASSWDNSVRVWEVSTSGMQVQAVPKMAWNHDAPALCVCFSKDGTCVFSGGCDNQLKMRNLQTNQEQVIGKHDGAICSVHYVDEMKMIVTGSWDKTVRFWNGQNPQPVATLNQPERVYSMDIKYPLMVVGMADRKLNVYNLDDIQRGNTNPHQSKQTKLMMQTRVIKCFNDRTGYAVGSVEGRVSIAYLDPAREEARENGNFQFKCHRVTGGSGRTNEGQIYSLNDIDFHPQGTFATAGGDGTFVFWDKDNRAKLKTFQSCKYPITAVRFSTQGDLFAYAVGYDWSKGHENNNPQYPKKIFIHKVVEQDVKPRQQNNRGRR